MQGTVLSSLVLGELSITIAETDLRKLCKFKKSMPLRRGLGMGVHLRIILLSWNWLIFLFLFVVSKFCFMFGCPTIGCGLLRNGIVHLTWPAF